MGAEWQNQAVERPSFAGVDIHQPERLEPTRLRADRRDANQPCQLPTLGFKSGFDRKKAIERFGGQLSTQSPRPDHRLWVQPT